MDVEKTINVVLDFWFAVFDIKKYENLPYLTMELLSKTTHDGNVNLIIARKYLANKCRNFLLYSPNKEYILTNQWNCSEDLKNALKKANLYFSYNLLRNSKTRVIPMGNDTYNVICVDGSQAVPYYILKP